MATFRLQEIRVKASRSDHQRQARRVPIVGGLVTPKNALVVMSGANAAGNLVNGAVAALALIQESNPDPYHVEAGADLGYPAGNNKSLVYVESIIGQRVIMSAGGAAWNPGAHLNVTRGVKKDGATGLSYIDLTDNATPAFRIIALHLEPMQDTAAGPTLGSFVMPVAGDTNVLVEAEILSTAGWLDPA